jgi:hypothetical protein
MSNNSFVQTKNNFVYKTNNIELKINKSLLSNVLLTDKIANIINILKSLENIEDNLSEEELLKLNFLKEPLFFSEEKNKATLRTHSVLNEPSFENNNNPDSKVENKTIDSSNELSNIINVLKSDTMSLEYQIKKHEETKYIFV